MWRRALYHSRPLSRYLSQVSSSTELQISERCAAQLKAIAQARSMTVALRVQVDGGGCSGFQYAFSVENIGESSNEQNEDKSPADKGGRPEEKDLIFREHGAEVRVDPISFEFIKGAKVDYEEELISSSFRVVDNPNSEQTCGCGTSFAAKM